MIIFDHVPKTGGSYVISALVNGLKAAGKPYSHTRIVWDGKRPDLETLRKSEAVVSSHWAFKSLFDTPLEEVADDDKYITWVRNPVDMFFSAWEFYRTPRASIPTEHAPLLRSQIREIWKAPTFDAYLEAAEAGAYVYPLGHIPDATRLQEYDFVGFCENMEHDLGTLGEYLGFELVPSNNARNASKGTLNRDLYRDRVEEIFDREAILT